MILSDQLNVFIAKKLYEQGLTLQQVAQHFGCSIHHVRIKLLGVGVKMRRGGRPLKEMRDARKVVG